MAESHIAKQTADKPRRAPLFHIVKRNVMPWYKAWAVRAIAILASFVLMGLVSLLVLHENPFRVFGTMFSGAFRYPKRTWRLFYDTAMLLLIALALTPAFRMRFWNIGAEGQVLIGGLCSFLCMKYLADLPNALLLLIMLVAGMAGGVIWTAIPAFFKAKWGTNETLFTLMMNYIAIQLTSFFVTFWENSYGSNIVGTINLESHKGWFPDVFGQMYGLNVIIVAVLAVTMYFYLKSTKHGFEIAVVGESHDTARYAAINVPAVTVRTVTLSGAVCGIAGFLAVAGQGHTISTNTAGGRGYVAIIVAWLAKFNTLVMILVSFLIVFLEMGAREIASKFNISDNLSQVSTGIILFFILGSEFFINYKVALREKDGAKQSAE